MDDRVCERSPAKFPPAPTLVSIVVAIILVAAIWVFPAAMTLLTRVLITVTLLPLVAYQAILTILALRGRENGPASERNAWLENAAMTLVCAGLVVVVWAF